MPVNIERRPINLANNNKQKLGAAKQPAQNNNNNSKIQPQKRNNQQQKPAATMQPHTQTGGAASQIPVLTKKSNLKKPAGENDKKTGDQPAFKPEVGHASQNTAILAGQSLPTNTMQNLLVGRKGENVANNVLHLFREYYTDPAVMSRLPRQHQNDALHRQLASFQRIVDEMEAHFSYSPSRFHAILVTIVNEAPHVRNNLRLGRLREIFEERVSDAQKVTGYLRDTDKRSKEFFESFLTELQYHKRLRQYFCQRIYSALYLYYYDEFDDISDGDEEYVQKVEALAKSNRLGGKRLNKNGKQSELAESDLILNKKEYLMGNYKAVNSWTEKRKLSYAVEHMCQLDKRWEALLDDNGVLAAEDFEPESSENMDQFNDYPAFEPILRLTPDLYVKTRKAVELATLWWTAANKLFPANPDQMAERPGVMDRINEIRKRVDRLTEELTTADMRTLPFQQDLDALLARDDHFNRLAADYENMAAQKREKLERHQKLEDRVSELEAETPYWSRRRAAKQQQQQQQQREVTIDFTEELKKLRRQMTKSYRNLRLVSYQFEVISGDYLAELTVRPTFVRFLDTCQQKLAASEGDIGEQRSDLAKGQREVVALMENYNKKRNVLEKYLPDTASNDKVGDRSREAAEKHQKRIQAQNNNNNNKNDNNNNNNNIRSISPPAANRNAQTIQPSTNNKKPKNDKLVILRR